MTQQPTFYFRAGLLAVLLVIPVMGFAAPEDPDKWQMFAVESALAGAGYDIDAADGIADSSTRQALLEFQKEQPGLQDTGKINEETLVALGIKREDAGYDREEAEKAAAQAKPAYDPATDAPPAGKAGNGEDQAVEEEDDGWIFSW